MWIEGGRLKEYGDVEEVCDEYVWNGTEFAFYEQHNIKANDLKKIKMMIDENSDLIIRHWNRYFGKEENNED